MHQFSIDSAGEVLAVLRAAFDAEPAGLSSAADVTRTIGASSGPPRGVNGPRPDAAPCDSALASAHAVLIDPTSAGDPPLPGAPTRPERPSSAAVAVTVPVGVPSDRELLGWVVSATQFTDRLEALMLALIGEAVRRDAAMTAVGCSLKSWLTEQLRVTNRAAGGLIHRAGAIGARPVLQAATLAGEVNMEQAAAIGVALGRLPEDLSTAQVDAGEATLIGYAGQFDATGLARLGNRLVEVIAPEVAEQADAKRLERERRLADRDRFLTFSHDGHGSVLLKGKMPALSAEPLIRVIDAYAEQFRRNALDRLDPLIERPSPGQRRLDALLTMVDAVQHASLAPTVGGDRPRVIVTVTYEDLLDQCTQAEILTTGQRLTAGELRMLACDADILPVVMNGHSVPMDVGAGCRLVTPEIRAALVLRDRGCVFPGCDVPPALCHAHHIVPWWAYGPTALHNLVLVCPHHHAIIEPSHDPDADRWTVELNTHGQPHIRPPRRVDPTRAPRMHQRFRQRFQPPRVPLRT